MRDLSKRETPSQRIERMNTARYRNLRDTHCLRCARMTRFDGSLWNHLHDGSPACVQPDKLTTKGQAMTTKKKGKGPALPVLDELMQPLVKDGKLTAKGKAAHKAVVEAIKAPVKKATAPPKRPPIPQHLLDAVNLCPPANPQERTQLYRAAKEAYVYEKAYGVKPAVLELFEAYRNQEHILPTTTHNNSKGNTMSKATKKSTKVTNSEGASRVSDEDIVAAVKAAKAGSSQKEIADSLRAKGFIVNGKRVGEEMLRQKMSPKGTEAKATAPAKAAPAKPAAKASKSAVGKASGKPLARATVTMLPKAKDAKATKATALRGGKSTKATAKKVTRKVR